MTSSLGPPANGMAVGSCQSPAGFDWRRLPLVVVAGTGILDFWYFMALDLSSGPNDDHGSSVAVVFLTVSTLLAVSLVLCAGAVIGWVACLLKRRRHPEMPV
jgi:hypothetical protein